MAAVFDLKKDGFFKVCCGFCYRVYWFQVSCLHPFVPQHNAFITRVENLRTISLAVTGKVWMLIFDILFSVGFESRKKTLAAFKL